MLQALSMRIRIFLNPQLFHFLVHTSCSQIEFTCPHAFDVIRIHSSTQGSSAIKCVQNMRRKAHDSGGK